MSRIAFSLIVSISASDGSMYQSLRTVLNVKDTYSSVSDRIDDIKGTGIAVKVDIHFLVFARLLTAIPVPLMSST